MAERKKTTTSKSKSSTSKSTSKSSSSPPAKAKDPLDPKVFHQISLVAFLAWVGLGADGLSSSAYGPEEAYLALGQHFYLALLLVIMTAATVFIISASYSQIIELFPTGGGGYLVATKLLGPTAGVVGGSALVVDYILTIAISVASGCDAIFSFLPPEWARARLARWSRARPEARPPHAGQGAGARDHRRARHGARHGDRRRRP